MDTRQGEELGLTAVGKGRPLGFSPSRALWCLQGPTSALCGIPRCAWLQQSPCLWSCHRDVLFFLRLPVLFIAGEAQRPTEPRGEALCVVLQLRAFRKVLCLGAAASQALLAPFPHQCVSQAVQEAGCHRATAAGESLAVKAQRAVLSMGLLQPLPSPPRWP